MAGEGDAKARFPRQEVNEGQEHGYLGDVEVYDPEVHAPGHSNTTAADKASGKRGKTDAGALVGHTTDADVQGDEG